MQPQPINYADQKANYKKLLDWLELSIDKYSRGREARRTSTRLKKLSLEETITQATEVNACLFVNSLLYYVFTEAKLDAAMLDKTKKSYPSNALYKLYIPLWTSPITQTKKRTLQMLNMAMRSLTSQDDVEFAMFMESNVIPIYLGVYNKQLSKKSDKYKQKVKSIVLAWAVNYFNAVLFPGKTENSAVGMRRAKEFIPDREKERAVQSKKDKIQKDVATLSFATNDSLIQHEFNVTKGDNPVTTEVAQSELPGVADMAKDALNGGETKAVQNTCISACLAGLESMFKAAGYSYSKTSLLQKVDDISEEINSLTKVVKSLEKDIYTLHIWKSLLTTLAESYNADS